MSQERSMERRGRSGAAAWVAAIGLTLSAVGGVSVRADTIHVPEDHPPIQEGIDAGDNTAVPKGITEDLDDNPRFVDDPDTKDTGSGAPPIVDPGAYELQGRSCPADIDNSGVVDFGDLLAILKAWGNPGGPEDLDGDGVVGRSDLLIAIASWGSCEFVVYFPFNGNAEDESGHENHGLIHGRAVFGSDRFDTPDSAIVLDGSDDYVEVPLTDGIRMTTNSFSVSVWIKTHEVPNDNKGIIGNYGAGGWRRPAWSLSVDPTGTFVRIVGTMASGADGRASTEGFGPVNDGRWHHVVGIRDRSNLEWRIALDGEIVDTGDDPTGDLDNGYTVDIGAHLSRRMQAVVDDVRIYRRALSDDEVTDLYHEGGWKGN